MRILDIVSWCVFFRPLKKTKTKDTLEENLKKNLLFLSVQ